MIITIDINYIEIDVVIENRTIYIPKLDEIQQFAIKSLMFGHVGGAGPWTRDHVKHIAIK